MQGYITNIEELTLNNVNFRQVLYTARHSQLVLMSILPGEEIGEEVHDLDQFLRIEAGTGKAVVNGTEYEIRDGTGLVVPAHTSHNIINTGTEPLKLYTIYSPPDHKDKALHHTKMDAENDTDDHWDGKTSES